MVFFYLEVWFSTGWKKLAKKSILSSGPWLPSDSVNGFHSHSFKHFLDQLDATNSTRWRDLLDYSIRTNLYLTIYMYIISFSLVICN